MYVRLSVAPPSRRSMLNAHGVRHSSADFPASNTPPLGSESKRTSRVAGVVGTTTGCSIGSAIGTLGCSTATGGGGGAGVVVPRPAYQTAAPMPSATATAPPANHTHHGVGAACGIGGGAIVL